MLVALVALGCVGPFSKKKPLTVQLLGDSLQNPSNGRGNAVVVRIYQLSDRSRFDQAALTALWKDEATTLGTALVGKSELTLLPRGKESLKITLDERARFVGVAADFISPDAAEWRRVYPISSVKKNLILIKVGQRQLSIRDSGQLSIN